MKTLLSAFFLLFLATAAFSQPGSLDSTFGNNGKVIEASTTSDFEITDAAIQTDNKSLVLAHGYRNGELGHSVLIRYNTNGTLDASFSGNGIAGDDVNPMGSFFATAVKLQPDGKILVSGAVDDSPTPSTGVVVRYNTDGSLDNSFGSGGIVYLPLFTMGNNSTTIERIYDIAVLSNNKIMLLTDNYSFNEELNLIRINPNGTIDNTFGTNGAIWYDVLNSYGYTYKKIEIQSDDKLIVAADPNIYNSNGSGYTGILLLRINTNGTIDNTYGTNGKLLLDAGTAYGDRLTDIALRSDNKIMVSGVGTDDLGDYNYQYFIRVNTNGTLDNSFGTNGKQFVDFFVSNFASYEGQISLNGNNQIVAAGYAYNTSGYYTVAALRLTANGVLDNGFGTGGVASVSINNYGSFGLVPLQQTDGKVVVAGAMSNNTSSVMGIARFTSAGQPDNSLNPATSFASVGLSSVESGLNIHVQPDQKLVSVSGRYNGFAYDLLVKRYQANGQPDAAFGTNGKTIVDFPGEYYQVFSGISANGAITIAPDFIDYLEGGKIAIARLKQNGTPDSSFGTNGKLLFKTKQGSDVQNPLYHAQFYPNGGILLLVGQNEGNPLQGTNRDTTFLIKLNSDGSYDNTFNNNGKLVLTGYGEVLSGSICLQPDGKILLLLSVGPYPYSNKYIRLLPNSVRDFTFNNGNAIQISDGVSTIAIQPDNKTLLISRNNIFRFNTNGTYDNTFGNLGATSISNYFPDSNNDYITDTKADSGKIVVMGSVLDPTSYARQARLVQLTTSGSIDSSFGQSGTLHPDIFLESGNIENLKMAIQADKKIVITGYDTAANINEYDYLFSLIRLKNNLSTGRTYTFTGNGAWSNPANWSGGMMPPPTITAGNSVIISTPAGGQCILDIPVTVQTGASFTVSAGSTLLLPGNLMIQ